MHVFKSPHDSAVKRTTCLLHREEMRTCRRPPTGFDSQPSSHLSGFCSKLTCTGSVLERTMQEHISSGQRSLWRVWRRSSDELCVYMPETRSSAGAGCSAAYLQPRHPGGTELRDQGQPELNCPLYPLRRTAVGHDCVSRVLKALQDITSSLASPALQSC